jgi:phage major head subunit gpT-like protein
MQAGSGPAWYLLDTTKALKPFIFQERQKPRFSAMDNPDDHTVFMRNVFTYGADSRNTAGFGFWQTAFGSKAALDGPNFSAGYTAMTLLRKDGGAPLGITPNVLLVGPTNRAAGEAIVKKMNLAGGESNLDYGRVELVVAPWLG